MYCYHNEIEKQAFAEGIRLQRLGKGDSISAVHWDFRDGVALDTHQHPQEQFGYIIRGGFQVTIGDETRLLEAGDAYFVPSNVPHRFVPVGDTEAIDVFTPVREP
jgi:quercetin dioxygenase-like cupin family protein